MRTSRRSSGSAAIGESSGGGGGGDRGEVAETFWWVVWKLESERLFAPVSNDPKDRDTRCFVWVGVFSDSEDFDNLVVFMDKIPAENKLYSENLLFSIQNITILLD